MSLHEIKAICDCDVCGKRFSAWLDAAYQLHDAPEGWSLFELVEDAVRGGFGDNDGLLGSSVQDGRMLCRDCTAKADADWRAEHPEDTEAEAEAEAETEAEEEAEA